MTDTFDTSREDAFDRLADDLTERCLDYLLDGRAVSTVDRYWRIKTHALDRQHPGFIKRLSGG